MNPTPESPPVIPDYTLLRAVGRGAYGEVWLARSVTGIYRAVKIVRRANFSDDHPFEREFAGIKRFEPVSLGQDSQVSILHVGRNDAAGFYYYVMEIADDIETGEEIFPDRYVPKTLKELRARRRRLPASESIDISLALTRALAHLHAHDLVHRDIKPSNVIFVHGIPKLADIGLVSATDTSHSYVGTEGFVPPEGPGRPPADVFSLGKVIYEISTGLDRNDYPRLPDDLDTFPDKRALLELNEVVIKACEADAQRRYATAGAMREDLLLLQAGRSVRRLHLMEQRFAIVAKYGVAATIATALAIGGFLWASAQTHRTRENLQRAERAESDAVAQAQKASASQQQSRRLLYASDMFLAQQVLKLNNVGRARRLLERNRPQPGEEDLRGWEWRYLWQLTRSHAAFTLTNRTARGTAVSFSPDGTRLAVGWVGGRVELWDVPGRRWVRALTDHESLHQLGRVAFSPVRNLLAATAGPDAVQLYDLEADRESILWRVPDPGLWDIRDLSFSPDGSRVVIYGGSMKNAGDAVWVADASSSRIQGPFRTIWSNSSLHGAARVSPDNRRLYLARSDSVNNCYNIQCLDLATGQELWQTERSRDYGLTALALSPDGQILASGSGFEDPTIRIWDATTGRFLFRLEGHMGWVCKLAFTQDGRRLISAASDQSIRFWDTSTWTQSKVLYGHTDEVYAIAISERAQMTASAGKDGNLMLWDEDGKRSADVYQQLPGELRINEVHLLDQSHVLLLPPGRPPEWADLRRSSPLVPMPEHGLSTNTLGFFGPNILCQWNGNDQIHIHQWSGTGFIKNGAIALNHGTRPTGFAYHPARQLAAWTEGTFSSSVYVASLAAPERRLELKSDVGTLALFRFSEDGNYLAATAEHDHSLRAWNVETGLTVASVNERVRSVAFAAGGRMLVATIEHGNDHEIGLFNLAHTNQAPRRIRGKGFANSLAISPDGRLVASATAAGLVELFDPFKGERIDSVHGHLNGASCVAFSPDGRRLISTSGGQEAVKLWDVGNRQELLNLKGIGSMLEAARWNADGDVIVAGPPWQVWRAPSWEEIAAVEAKEKTELNQP